jgi:hypothetical protein
MAAAKATKVFDKEKEAVWVVNLGAFRFAHGTREGVVFDPQVATRVKMDEWIESQAPLLVQVEDPYSEDLPASPVIDPNPLVSEKTGKSVTGVGTGPEGSGNADDVRKAQETAKAGEKKADAKK